MGVDRNAGIKPYVSHDKKGRWEILEPQDAEFVVANCGATRAPRGDGSGARRSLVDRSLRAPRLSLITRGPTPPDESRDRKATTVSASARRLISKRGKASPGARSIRKRSQRIYEPTRVGISCFGRHHRTWLRDGRARSADTCSTGEGRTLRDDEADEGRLKGEHQRQTSALISLIAPSVTSLTLGAGEPFEHRLELVARVDLALHRIEASPASGSVVVYERASEDDTGAMAVLWTEAMSGRHGKLDQKMVTGDIWSSPRRQPRYRAVPG